jgi:hypothetical protein
MGAVEADVRTDGVEADINYLAEGSDINRRFVAPGAEVNTGTYLPHRVRVRDARPMQDRFTLDSHGFVLAKAPSKVTDFSDKAEVDATYPAEVVETVRRLTGATRVAPMGWMVRTSGEIAPVEPGPGGYSHQGGVQPPAGEAHVDMTPDRAENLANAIYARTFPDGPGFKRFIASSLWRAFSPPPQDWPLAVCDGNTVRPDEGTPNTMFVVDKLPSREEMFAEMPGEARAMAAAVFRYSPDHRWWYFSNMTRDEVLMFKFHDSDRSRAWRTPHTAFHDPTFPDARVRESIEFRTVAFFE